MINRQIHVAPGDVNSVETGIAMKAATSSAHRSRHERRLRVLRCSLRQEFADFMDEALGQQWQPLEASSGRCEAASSSPNKQAAVASPKQRSGAASALLKGLRSGEVAKIVDDVKTAETKVECHAEQPSIGGSQRGVATKDSELARPPSNAAEISHWKLHGGREDGVQRSPGLAQMQFEAHMLRQELSVNKFSPLGRRSHGCIVSERLTSDDKATKLKRAGTLQLGSGVSQVSSTTSQRFIDDGKGEIGTMQLSPGSVPPSSTLSEFFNNNEVVESFLTAYATHVPAPLPGETTESNGSDAVPTCLARGSPLQRLSFFSKPQAGISVLAAREDEAVREKLSQFPPASAVAPLEFDSLGASSDGDNGGPAAPPSSTVASGSVSLAGSPDRRLPTSSPPSNRGQDSAAADVALEMATEYQREHIAFRPPIMVGQSSPSFDQEPSSSALLSPSPRSAASSRIAQPVSSAHDIGALRHANENEGDLSSNFGYWPSCGSRENARSAAWHEEEARDTDDVTTDATSVIANSSNVLVAQSSDPLRIALLPREPHGSAAQHFGDDVVRKASLLARPGAMPSDRREYEATPSAGRLPPLVASESSQTALLEVAPPRFSRPLSAGPAAASSQSLTPRRSLLEVPSGYVRRGSGASQNADMSPRVAPALSPTPSPRAAGMLRRHSSHSPSASAAHHSELLLQRGSSSPFAAHALSPRHSVQGASTANSHVPQVFSPAALGPPVFAANSGVSRPLSNFIRAPVGDFTRSARAEPGLPRT